MKITPARNRSFVLTIVEEVEKQLTREGIISPRVLGTVRWAVRAALNEHVSVLRISREEDNECIDMSRSTPTEHEGMVKCLMTKKIADAIYESDEFEIEEQVLLTGKRYWLEIPFITPQKKGQQ